jgi:3-oxoacyl-[acyl-carrier protein] reductase
MDLGLAGRRALVTGASKGIGLAIADALAGEGCDVAICARGRDALEQAEARLRAHRRKTLMLACDVADAESIASTLSAAQQGLGGVDILVNNAGGDVDITGLEEVPMEVWNHAIQINVLAALRFTLGVLPGMREGGWGRVVTITSTLGRQGGGTPWYNVAKTAQTALMKNLARRKDLVRAGITFNCVAPGPIATPDSIWGKREREDAEALRRLADDRFPLGRVGRPVEVAHAVAFICSARATYVNGATLAVDGGDSPVF